MIQFLIEGFLLGIATGLGCVAHCGPIYAPLLMQKKMKPWESVFMVLEISAGRFVAYISFGILIGMVGKHFAPNNNLIEIFTAVSFLVLSVMMIMAALGYRREEKGCSRNKMMKFSNAPFLLGLITGIHICPSFLIALTNGLATKGPWGGGMLFFGFYMGTNVWLMPFSVIGFLGNLVSAKNLRRGAMVTSILVGAWFIGKATTSFVSLMYKPEIMTVMDTKPLYIVCDEGENLAMVESVLNDGREGKIIMVGSLSEINQDSSYILVTPKLFAKDPEAVKATVKPGRFVGIIPEPLVDGFSNKYSVILASFLSRNYVKVDKDGTFFNMSKMLKTDGISVPKKKGKAGCGSCPSAKSCGV